MKAKKYAPQVMIILALAISSLFFSCDVFKDETNDIAFAIECMGGTGAASVKDKFTALILSDGTQTFNIPTTTNAFAFPLGNKTKLTITATKLDMTSTLIIMVFKNGQIDEKGYLMLPSCDSSSSTTSCTNSLTLTWELNTEEDTSKAAAATTDTTTTTTK
jgi:hypothetical protein